MPYIVKASFTDKDGHQYNAGEIYDKVDDKNADLMEEVKDKQVPSEKTVMTKESIKQK